MPGQIGGPFKPRPREVPRKAVQSSTSKNPGLGGGAMHLDPYLSPVITPKPMKIPYESEWERIEREAGYTRSRFYPKSDACIDPDGGESFCSSAPSGYYKAPIPAGLPRGVEPYWDNFDLYEEHGPEGHLHHRIGDGFTRKPPVDSELQRKAIPGYKGYIPGWQQTHHGVGKTFHAHREVCLRHAPHAGGKRLARTQRRDPRVETRDARADEMPPKEWDDCTLARDASLNYGKAHTKHGISRKDPLVSSRSPAVKSLSFGSVPGREHALADRERDSRCEREWHRSSGVWGTPWACMDGVDKQALLSYAVYHEQNFASGIRN